MTGKPSQRRRRGRPTKRANVTGSTGQILGTVAGADIGAFIPGRYVMLGAPIGGMITNAASEEMWLKKAINSTI